MTHRYSVVIDWLQFAIDLEQVMKNHNHTRYDLQAMLGCGEGVIRTALHAKPVSVMSLFQLIQYLKDHDERFRWMDMHKRYGKVKVS